MSRQRSARERRAFSEPKLIDYGRRQVAKAYRTFHHTACRGVRREDHERNADDVKEKTEAVAEHAMIAKCLPMIRGDDHNRVVEKPLAFELGQQPTQLFVEESDAIVVAIAGRRDGPFAFAFFSIVIFPSRKL